MTTSYEKFLTQFNSTGRQKSDGYDNSHFSEMNEEEKSKSFELLKNEILSPEATKWLDLLDRNRTIELVKPELHTKVEGSSGTHHFITIFITHYTLKHQC